MAHYTHTIGYSTYRYDHPARWILEELGLHTRYASYACAWASRRSRADHTFVKSELHSDSRGLAPNSGNVKKLKVGGSLRRFCRVQYSINSTQAQFGLVLVCRPSSVPVPPQYQCRELLSECPVFSRSDNGRWSGISTRMRCLLPGKWISYVEGVPVLE